MKKWIFRVFLGALFAGLMIALALTPAVLPAQAGPALQEGANPTAQPEPTATPAAQEGASAPTPSNGPKLEGTNDLNCKTCHAEFQAAWEKGAHSHSFSDPAFAKAWQDQGSPRQCLTCHTTGYDAVKDTFRSAQITCEACHGPIPANHPTDPMPVDRSPKLCSNCHTETFFDWQVSQHRKVDLGCQGCHDPHGTTLKASDASTLCTTCHRDRVANFAHSPHAQQGLNCADCHLAKMDNQAGQGHATRDHTFRVSLTTCNSCHSYQMHDPAQVHADRPTPTPPPDSMSSVESLGVSTEPSTTSPVGFTALSGLIGLAAGMVLAPWLERWYRRLNARDDEE